MPPTKFRIDARKIVGYLLNADHPDGGPKARFFLARGFSLDDVPAFARSILDHPDPSRSVLTKTLTDAFATKFVYEGPLLCPDGSRPSVRTVWELRPGDTHGRLVTAYPRPKALLSAGRFDVEPPP